MIEVTHRLASLARSIHTFSTFYTDTEVLLLHVHLQLLLQLQRQRLQPPLRLAGAALPARRHLVGELEFGSRGRAFGGAVGVGGRGVGAATASRVLLVVARRGLGMDLVVAIGQLGHHAVLLQAGPQQRGAGRGQLQLGVGAHGAAGAPRALAGDAGAGADHGSALHAAALGGPAEAGAGAGHGQAGGSGPVQLGAARRAVPGVRVAGAGAGGARVLAGGAGAGG